MESSHVAALQAKHEGLERRIREEMSRPAPDNTMVQTLKKQKLRIKRRNRAHLSASSLFQGRVAARRRQARDPPAPLSPDGPRRGEERGVSKPLRLR